MDKYDNLGMVGEGSYGTVMKCRHKETNQLVAIKKFLESEDDKVVKKIAMREIKMLRQLQHDHLVNLLEVFRRKKRLYLVFEFVDHTVLDDLERNPHGLDESRCKKILWQVLKGTEFCHNHNIIHRDIKPENILVSKSNVVKLCDFGFARTLAAPGEIYTDYVATRWYRAPELLVGDTTYGKAVDIWAIGCLLAEMLTGDPLFPGDSDIDQLHLIMKCFGPLHSRHKEIFMQNPLFTGVRLPEVKHIEPLEKKIPRVNKYPNSLDFMKVCMRLDAMERPSCTQLVRHPLFTTDNFGDDFAKELRRKIDKEKSDSNSLYKILKGERDNRKQASFASKFQNTKQIDEDKKGPPTVSVNQINNTGTGSLPQVKKAASENNISNDQIHINNNLLNNKTNSKQHISPNLPNVNEKSSTINNNSNQTAAVIDNSDKQSVISKRSDNSRGVVDQTLNPNPAMPANGAHQGTVPALNSQYRTGITGGVNSNLEPTKSPMKTTGNQPNHLVPSKTTMPPLTRNSSITYNNKTTGGTLTSKVTPSPPGGGVTSDPKPQQQMSPQSNVRNTSPTALNKTTPSGPQNYVAIANGGGASYQHNVNSTYSPPTSGMSHQSMAINGVSPRTNVQSMGSVVNIGVDSIPKDGYPNGMSKLNVYPSMSLNMSSKDMQRPSSQQIHDTAVSGGVSIASNLSKNNSNSVPIWAGISSLKRSYTNVHKRPKLPGEVTTQSCVDQTLGGGYHSPSPRSENSFKPKEFRPAGILADSNNSNNSKSLRLKPTHHVALGGAAAANTQQQFSPPANLQASSFSNTSHKDGRSGGNFKSPSRTMRGEKTDSVKDSEITNTKGFEAFKKSQQMNFHGTH